MSRPRRADSKQPISFRFRPKIIDLIDQAAKRRGWTRQQWMDRLIERGLQGEGLLDRQPDQPAKPAPTEVTPQFKDTK